MLTNIQNHVDTVGWQNIEALLEGFTPVPSGVVRVMELQELGYAYVKP